MSSNSKDVNNSIWKSIGERVGYPLQNTREYTNKVELYRRELTQCKQDAYNAPPMNHPITFICDRCGYCPKPVAYSSENDYDKESSDSDKECAIGSTNTVPSTTRNITASRKSVNRKIVPPTKKADLIRSYSDTDSDFSEDEVVPSKSKSKSQKVVPLKTATSASEKKSHKKKEGTAKKKPSAVPASATGRRH